jgi:hypothetical protein
VVAGNIFWEVTTLKRFVFLSLSVLLLLILIPVTGCITFQIPQSAITQPAGTTPVIGTFTNSPSTINSGGSTTLLWNVTGANSVSIDHGIGQVDAAGVRAISPVSSTVYTLSATNSAGTVTRSAATTVNSIPTPLPVPYSVTGVIAGTEQSYRSGCFSLFALITANGPCTVTYVWESTAGGGYSYTWTIKLPEAGTQKIKLPVDMSALPSGPYRVHVLTPNDVVSNSTYYETCLP